MMRIGPFYIDCHLQCQKEIKSFQESKIFIIHISLQPDGSNLWYFKLRLYEHNSKFKIYKVYDFCLQRNND